MKCWVVGRYGEGFMIFIGLVVCNGLMSMKLVLRLVVF